MQRVKKNILGFLPPGTTDKVELCHPQKYTKTGNVCTRPCPYKHPDNVTTTIMAELKYTTQLPTHTITNSKPPSSTMEVFHVTNNRTQKNQNVWDGFVSHEATTSINVPHFLDDGVGFWAYLNNQIRYLPSIAIVNSKEFNDL